MDRIVNALNSARSPFHWMTFGGFLTIAVIVRLAAFQGYSDSDPRAYAKLADDLAHGTLCIADYHHAPNFPLRCGVYAPVALLIKAFGLSEWTLVAYPMVVSVLGCLLAYAMTRGLGTPLAGLIAMGGVAVIPMDVSLASRLYPDAIGAFWGNLGIALVVVALSRLKSWQSVTLGVLSGTIFGVSWLCKESIVYQVPLCRDPGPCHRQALSMAIEAGVSCGHRRRCARGAVRRGRRSMEDLPGIPSFASMRRNAATFNAPFGASMNRLQRSAGRAAVT